MASSVDVLPHQVQERTAQEIEKSPLQVQDVLFQLVPYGSLSYCWAFNCITDTSIPRNYRHVNGWKVKSTHNAFGEPAARLGEEGGSEDYLPPRQDPSRSGRGLRPLHPNWKS